MCGSGYWQWRQIGLGKFFRSAKKFNHGSGLAGVTGCDNPVPVSTSKNYSELDREELIVRLRALEESRGSNEDLRSRLATIVEYSDDAIIRTDLTGKTTEWNRAAERIFGYSLVEIIGRPVQLLLPSDRSNEEEDILQRIRSGEHIDHFETWRRRKDGQLIPVSLKISPIRDAVGRVVGVSKIARDISDRKQAEERLLGTVNELKNIKAALDEHSIVAITDAAGRITYVNDKFCAISKYSREELLGRDHRIINSRHHPKTFFRDLWSTIGRGQVWHGEIKNRAKDGSFYWVETTIFPFVNAAGNPTQYVAIRTDITQRKADEAQLQQFASDLAEKNKELETIVYTVSHDLRSPLVNVQGFGKQLSRACEKIKQAADTNSGAVPHETLSPLVEVSIPQALRFINAGVNKMEMLLAGLLRYSRLGRVILSIGPIDMNALIAGVLAAAKFQIDEAHAEVSVSPLPSCLGDNTHTNQVFANLVDNALKYRDPVQPLRLAISGRIEGDKVIYSVSDNGVGIPLEHQPKVFEIFHRLNPETTVGEGLGLTIAQRVLERQRGRLWVESGEGVGSTFFVSLPVAPDMAS